MTFVFTDIEGSTGLLQALGHVTYGHLQDEHSAILRAAIDQGRVEDAARLLGAWERIELDFLLRFPDVAIAQFGDPAVAARGALGDEAYERARSPMGASWTPRGSRRW